MSNNCLQIMNPELAKEWHPTKNGSKTPKDIAASTHKKVWWICSRGHEWNAMVSNRSRGRGCPYCAGRLACADNCLQTVNPGLAKEWHPIKNGSLTAKDVTIGTHRKVWWVCDRGHEWEGTVDSRSRSRGCPYCAGKLICDDNCLQTLNPEVAKEWHLTKNGGLTPRDVFQNSNKKYWWRCGKGHEWQATINNRSSGRGCPYCIGKAVCEDNCLQTLNPELAREWHPTKNGSLTPGDVTTQSNKKVWWVCSRGHEWPAVVYSRSKGNRCPQCSIASSRLELRIYSELKYLFNDAKLKEKINGMECDIYIPELKVGIELDSLYWHRSRLMHDREKAAVLKKKGVILINVREVGLKKISDNDIIMSSHDSDFSIIERIIVAISQRFNLSDSVRMAIEEYLQRKAMANDAEYRRMILMLPSPAPDLSLSEQNPNLVKEWHVTKNDSLTPKDVTPGSSRMVWWKCDKGHEWEAIVYSRSKGIGCPYCAGKAACEDNCLQTLNPELAKQWHPIKNNKLTPGDVTPGNHNKVWWKCDKGHEWEAIVYSRSEGNGCPYCAGKAVCEDNCLQTINPQLAREWHPSKNERLTPRDVTPDSHKKVWWRCDKGHEWESTVSHRSSGRGCPYCAGKAVCDDNCLQTINPQLAKQWHPKRNAPLTPRDVTSGSARKVWWMCQRGHEWPAVVYSRSKGKGCPYCSHHKHA